MGLQDRDYMHDRGGRPRPFTPPSSRGSPVWLMVLVVAGGAFVLFNGYEWLLEQRAVPPTTQERGPGPERFQQPPVQVRPAPAPAPAPPSSHWVRCEVNGQTLYSDTKCPNNTEIGRAPADVPSHAAVASGSRVKTLYHCKAYSGGTFWVGTHCNQHKALVDRTVSVPAHLPFDQQVQIAESQRRAATQLHSSSTTTTVINNVVVSDKKDECLSLTRHIEQLDAWARQPLSAQQQDRIRDQRKQARDRQFALRC